MDEPRDAGDPSDEPSVVARLEAIERRLEALTERLDAMTAPPPCLAPAAERPRSIDVALPPSTATWPPRDRSDVARSPLAPAPLPPAAEWQNVPRTAKDAEDLEYKLGVTGLLRGGAVVVIVGIVYLVGLALSRGWVTPLAQFIGEIALCLGFVGFGYAKRQEREEFGGLLMGIGSCGLYLSFAGGHVFKDLYPARIVVVLFLLLSFANLGYAWWRASRSFWIIGIVGGLLAAAMPMREDRQTAALILHSRS